MPKRWFIKQSPVVEALKKNGLSTAHCWIVDQHADGEKPPRTDMRNLSKREALAVAKALNDLGISTTRSR